MCEDCVKSKINKDGSVSCYYDEDNIEHYNTVNSVKFCTMYIKEKKEEGK